ncbi:MAG: hypothetical protein EXS32_06950 [Opitutus sp.]|nr:hypothetical protein [Opitutus sp.]
MKLRSASLALGFSLLLAPAVLRAWDYEGHRMVNQVALAALPKDFPAFVQAPAAAERIAFLAGEADRWRNLSYDQPLYNGAAMDHYFDVEQVTLAGLDRAKLPSLRYEFAAQFAAGRAAHRDEFPPIDEARNSGHTREWCGFLPWAVAENFHKLRAAFSYLKTFEELGTKEEIANAQANVLYYMGFLGHFVGDGAQPLHSTHHSNGWAGPNPHGYTIWPGFHSWIDSGFIAKAGIKFADLAPRVTPAGVISLAPRPDGRDAMFVAVVDYLLVQHQRVEPLYQMEKAGQLGHGEQPVLDETRAFIQGQLLVGGEMLAAIWATAWKGTVPDTFLRAALLKRDGGAAPVKAKAKKRVP